MQHNDFIKDVNVCFSNAFFSNASNAMAKKQVSTMLILSQVLDIVLATHFSNAKPKCLILLHSPLRLRALLVATLLKISRQVLDFITFTVAVAKTALLTISC